MTADDIYKDERRREKREMQWRVNCQLFPTSAPVAAQSLPSIAKSRKKDHVAMTTSDFGSFDSWNQESREEGMRGPCFNNEKEE